MLKKDCMSLTMINLFQYLMASNFLGPCLTPSHDKICPMKSISFRVNSLFVQLTKSLFSWSLLKIYFKCFACSFVVLEYTKISSILMITNSSNLSWKMEFMKVVNIDETLHNLNGIIRNSYKPYMVLITIFSTFSSQCKFHSTLIWDQL